MTSLKELMVRALDSVHTGNPRHEASAIIAAFKANGLVVVPRKPTTAMTETAVLRSRFCPPNPVLTYQDCLAASPYAKEFE